jgi:integrative and conjugative element protein (TIGR02256 family)
MKIWIKKDIIDQIFSGGNSWSPKETGGVLMGYITTDHYVVTDLIGPGPNAVHSLFSFQPDQEFHKQEIAALYEQSEQRTKYLGDWHTHPNSFPYLSSTDKKTAQKIAAYSEARLSNPVMLVAAPPSLAHKAWIYKKSDSNENLFEEAEIILY